MLELVGGYEIQVKEAKEERMGECEEKLIGRYSDKEHKDVDETSSGSKIRVT